MSRVTIFDKNGYFVGDIRVATVRSWTLASTGVIGECSWDMSLFDTKATTKYLDFGKYVLVRHSLLPDWIGFLYPPQEWGFNSISPKAYQMEKILEFRNTPDETISETAGELFRDILHTTNSWDGNEKPIRPDNIFPGGPVFEVASGSDALSHITDLAQRAGNDFEVIHSFDVYGRIYLKGNWYEEKGTDTKYWLREGKNCMLSDSPMQLQSPLANDLTGYLDADTKGTRVQYRARDTTSFARYGLFQSSAVYNNVTNVTTMQTSVLSDLEKSAHGQRVFDITALNVGSTFRYLRPGNILGLDLNRAGFKSNGSGYGYNGLVRIIGMEHDDLAENQVKLSVESYDEPN